MRWTGYALTLVLVAVVASVGTAQVAILAPRDGETVRSRRLTVRVQKPTNDGYVMVWLDSKFVAAISSPFEVTIDLAERDALTGSHTLRVVGVDKSNRVEGEAQVQFQVDLTGAGLAQGEVQLIFQGRTGEIMTYSFRGVSETKVEVPAKAIRRKVPQLSSRLTFRWLQTVRDITIDRLLRLVRTVDEGTLEREVPIAATGLGTGMMGGETMGSMGAPMGGPPTGGLMMGAPFAGGMSSPMGAPTAGAPMAGATSPTRLRLLPTDDQRFGFLTLLPNGEVVTGQELPSVVRFVAGSVDLLAPSRPLKVGDTWQGVIVLPRNLDNLTLVGAPTGGMGMGMPGGEAMGAPGAPTPLGMPGAPPGVGRPGLPMGPTAPMGPMGPMGAPGMPGAGGTPGRSADAYLADAPVVQVPAIHRLDGFELWRDRLCARIVSRFKITAELDIGGAQQATGMGMAGGEGMAPMGAPMMGAPYGSGAPFTAGTSPMMGAPMGPTPFGGVPGQMPTTRKLTGVGEGTRTLLFDLQNGQVVYAKVEVKVTFNTDWLTVWAFAAPSQQQMGAPTGAPAGPMGAPSEGMMPSMMSPGAPMGGMSPMGPTAPMGPGRPMMSGAPGMEGPMPGAPYGGPSGYPAGSMGYGGPFGGAPTATTPPFRNVPAKVLYTYTIENTLEASGRLDMALKYLGSQR